MASPEPPPRPGVVRIPQHVVYRSFVSETVLLNLNTGKYHGLNRTAGRMLEVLDEIGDIQLAVDRLVSDFDQPSDVVRRDLDTFCTDLLERGLIVLEHADE